MLKTIHQILEVNGPLPAELLVSMAAECGVTVTVEQLIDLGERDELTTIEVKRPDRGVFLIFSHPGAAVRVRNFR